MWFGAALPVTYNNLRDFNVGLSLRAGPLFFGTGDIGSFLWKNSIESFSFFGGLKVPVAKRKSERVYKYSSESYYHRVDSTVIIKETIIYEGDTTGVEPGDYDGDGILDADDDCVDVPGPASNNGCPEADKDGDGVLDRDDDCIDVPGPVANSGCPVSDKDGDGVPDSEDDCIDNPGPVANKGCPIGDKDSDGVPDSKDDCIDVAGPAHNNGCPEGDRDGDGVLDKDDECIDTPGPAANKGCPEGDKDGDGVLDKDDECIDLPGPVANKGCPYADKDNDGVIDTEDDCPLTPGLKENKGCPKLEKEEEEILQRAFDNLEFDTNKDVIRQVSFASLNELADLMKKKSEWRLALEGHTDSDGSDEANMDLSRRRTLSVKKFLSDRGVEGERILTTWFGETRPLVPNDTPANKQKNRRVEMEIVFE